MYSNKKERKLESKKLLNSDSPSLKKIFFNPVHSSFNPFRFLQTQSNFRTNITIRKNS